MTLTKSLQQYLKQLGQDLGIETLEQDIIIGRAPSSNETSDDIWWMITNGGGILQKNQTGEARKSYAFLVYRRGRNYREIDEELQTLEENINCDRCSVLEGFDTIDIEATVFPTDDDLDSEDRKVGMLQVTVTTYKEC